MIAGESKRVTYRWLLPLTLLAAVAAGLAVVVHLVYFPRYSPDADEAAYLLQARALSHGHLTLSAAAHGRFFRPWLTGEYHGRLFTKYLPGLPAVLAASLKLFGSAVPALGVIAASWVVSTYAAAVQLLGDRRPALLASGLVALSPIALVQSSLYLSYALNSALLFGGVAATLVGLSRAERRWSVLSGVFFGCALLTRPFDVWLVLLPLVMLVALRYRREVRRLIRALAWSVLGAVPLVGLLLAFNAAVTGSALRMPLPGVEPLDTFGFGIRRIMPADPLTAYYGRRAVAATARNLILVPKWGAGGVLLVVLAVLGAVAARRRIETWFLVTVSLAFPAAYFFFWGNYIASQGLGQVIGPFYYTTVFVPLAILAAQGILALSHATPTRLRTPALAALTVVALILTGLNMQSVRRFHVERRQQAEHLLSLIPARSRLRLPAVVLVQIPFGSRYVGVNQPYLENDPGLHSPVLFAASNAAEDNHLADEAPGRALYVFRPQEPSGGSVFNPTAVGTFVPLAVVRGTRLRASVEARSARPGRCLTAYLRWGPEQLRRELTCSARPGQVYRTDFVIGPRGDLPLPPTGTDVLLTVGVGNRAPHGSAADLAETRISLGVRSGQQPEAVALVPGEPWRLLNLPRGQTWLEADAARQFTYRLTPG